MATTQAPRAPVGAHRKPWDKVSGERLFSSIKVLTIGCALFYAAVQFVI